MRDPGIEVGIAPPILVSGHLGLHITTHEATLHYPQEAFQLLSFQDVQKGVDRSYVSISFSVSVTDNRIYIW